ncbi:ArnT family glycosyltransferase [Aeromicrobium choanae]|uniref:Dolichyl-phosphate-mannose-protein mannosyltransferase n=1 Tax=Aeromicrobium choanae TaxID=1736691 RepID=A0A1T4Z8R4_9ACTN|nr:glycosyltransferase family 39 protein [Aeromicrobium choanae]SKB10253.1 Dolichyl-phosphate-mannose-protein mannosyltransferase [Aeromicrobium choanae]
MTTPRAVPRAVLLVVLAAVLVRLPFVAVLPSPDEAGLLLVGGQWGPGDSLYGDFWVDRPPLLVAWAELAARAGGVVALRVVGLVAVALTIVACAAAAGRVSGERPARWAAVTAALLTVSPWLGAERVNGELLAAPWIAGGLYAAIRAVQERRGRWALATGAAIAGAVLTKQNHADAAVFAVVLLVLSVAAGSLRTGEALGLAAGALGGAVLVTVVVVGAAWLRGTDPVGLFDALFAFRVRAADVMAAAPPGAQDGRQAELLGRAALGGQLILVLGVLLAPLAERFRSPVALAAAAATAFGCLSVLASGSWWNHYLVELAAPVAVGTGLIAARTRIVVPAVLAYSTVAAVIGTFVVLPAVDSVDGPVAAGRMIGASSRAGDTVVNAWGRPDLVLASGLDSPYEHLWSLPVRTDDSGLEEFTRLVSGGDAPTWLVMNGSLGTWGIDSDAAQRVVDRRYRRLAGVCGLDLLVLRDTPRPTPAVPEDVRCEPPTVLR